MSWNKLGTFVVPNRISQLIDTELIKTYKTPDCLGNTKTIEIRVYVPPNSIFRNPLFILVNILLLDLGINSDYFPIQHWHCFVLPRRSVFCAVRTQSLNKFALIFRVNSLCPLCLSWPYKYRPTEVVIVERKECTEVCGLWFSAVPTAYSSFPIVVLLQRCDYSLLCFSKNLCRDSKQPIKRCLPVTSSDVPRGEFWGLDYWNAFLLNNSRRM
jgi:hypothetical protein